MPHKYKIAEMTNPTSAEKLKDVIGKARKEVNALEAKNNKDSNEMETAIAEAKNKLNVLLNALDDA